MSRAKSSDTADTLADFREQCRRNMARSVDQRIKYGFCYVYKPVMDDADYRVFDSMAEYRAWCHAHLPRYLGYQILNGDGRAAGDDNA